MKMNDAVVLVTGANRGLGRALVQRLLDAGARKVYATARRPEQLADLERAGRGKVVPLALDVNDAASIAAAAKSAPDVTVLVNNAGVLASGSLLTSNDQAIGQEFATNVFGTLAVTKAFLPSLERAGSNGGAAIVNVLSVVSLASMPAIGAYSASKAAAYSMTLALRSELAGRKVAVHAVLPGPIDTDMVRGMEMPKTSPEAVAKAIVEGVERGHDDIAPDPMAADVVGQWGRDPKAVERQFASMSG